MGDPASDPHTPSPQAGPTPLLESPPVPPTLAHRTLPEGMVLGVGRAFSSGTVMEHSVTPSVRTSHKGKRLYRPVPWGATASPTGHRDTELVLGPPRAGGGGSVRNLPFDKHSPNRNVRSCASLHRLTSQHPHHAPRPLPVPQAARTSVSPGRHSTGASLLIAPCLSPLSLSSPFPGSGLILLLHVRTPTCSPPKSSRIFASTHPLGRPFLHPRLPNVLSICPSPPAALTVPP